MTIGNYGSMEISNKESLKLFLKIYFGLWHYRFNYNNYKKNVYPLLLNNKYSDNDTKAETDIDNLNIDSIILETKVDNNLILWELKTVKSQIKNINAYLKQGGYRGNFNLENKTHKDAFNKFLKTLKEFDTKTKGEVYLQEIISNSDENWQVFFLNVLLKDYLKIESFLIKKIRLDNQQNETGELTGANPYPKIFTGFDEKAFLLFDTFAKKNIVDRYQDFSFLFQQLKKDGHMHNVKHIDFMKWLKEHNYISEIVLDKFLSKGSFSNKYNTPQRINVYDNIKTDVF
jgi:hypothetical protein